MRALLLAAALTLAACGQNHDAPPAQTSAPSATAASGDALFTYGGGQAPLLAEATAHPYERSPPPTWFICDSIDGADIFVATRPDEGGAFQLARYSKTTLQTERMSVRLSGDVFAAPNGPAQSFTDADGAVGVIYTLDAARMSAPDAATTTPVISLDFAGEEFNCRWFEHMLFIGFTGTQSVVVRRVGANTELMTFAFDSEGALMVEMQHGEQSTITDITAENGRASDGYNRDDVLQWLFEHASDGADYIVWTAIDEPSVLQEVRGGEVKRTDEFQAFALARS